MSAVNLETQGETGCAQNILYYRLVGEHVFECKKSKGELMTEASSAPLLLQGIAQYVPGIDVVCYARI